MMLSTNFPIENESTGLSFPFLSSQLKNQLKKCNNNAMLCGEVKRIAGGEEEEKKGWSWWMVGQSTRVHQDRAA